jgi:hypothetical protein
LANLEKSTFSMLYRCPCARSSITE